MTTITAEVEARGFAIIREFLSHDDLARLGRLALGSRPGDGGQRNLLDVPEIMTLANNRRIRQILELILGRDHYAVRALLFDKTADANWKVAWHQDLTIAVRERRDVPGFGPWSTKAGVVHVQPPLPVLEHMLAVRLHFDECGLANGPLRVLPGSHRAGKIPEGEISSWPHRVSEEICLVPRGGALLMRPLVLHASSTAMEPTHRRVIHIEYASSSLPGGLEWRWANSQTVGAA